MSQENNHKPRNEGGQRRQGNRNNNRNRNNQGGNRNNQGGNRNNQGRQSGGGPNSPQRRSSSRPMPLTTWEKILKFFGLYKQPTRPPRRQSNAQNEADNQSEAPKKAAKSNTRTARGQGDNGGKQAKRDFPVETPRLYLGNLSYEADESVLEELFKGVGTVRSVEIVYNRHTHRSKGFGFIEMQNVEEAKRAVETLHDKPFMGRNLVVNGANNKPKEDTPTRERQPRENNTRENNTRENNPRERKPAQQRDRQQPDRQSKNAARLYLGNLSFDADESSIEDFFKGIGNVRKVELVYNKQTHRSKGFGFIEMQKTADAQRAIEVLHDQPFMGRKIVVSANKDNAQDSSPTETAEATAPTEEPTPTPAAEPASEPVAEEPTPAVEATAEITPEATPEPVVEAIEEPTPEKASAE